MKMNMHTKQRAFPKTTKTTTFQFFFLYISDVISIMYDGVLCDINYKQYFKVENL